MKQLGILSLVAALVCALPARANAEVVESTPSGFTVRHVATFEGPPARIYAALVDIAGWWDPEHTYSGKSANLSLDARAGGCFCERVDDRGSALHMMIVLALPGHMLRMTGGLGPLQEAGVSGALTFAFADLNGRTELTMTYVVGGYVKGGLLDLAAPVDAVLGAQLQRLREYVGKM